jgi:hypothetical protein
MAPRWYWLTLLVLVVSCEAATAQQQAEFLPEVDAYLKLNPIVRLRFQAANTREGGEPTQLTIGPDVQLYMKPLVKLKEVTAFDLDDAKARPLVFAAGYRYLTAPNSPSTNRIDLAVTSHLPIGLGLLLSDRNRSDLDWSDGKFQWRYRNKLDLQKTVRIHSYHPSPYTSVEVYYESKYQKWSTTEIDIGSLFPLGKHFQLDTYYEHQNNTGKSPNSQINATGVTLNMFFSRE